jgi:hypothetical protein
LIVSTILAALAAVVLIEFIFPFITFLLMLPFSAIGRRVRRLMPIMWFIGRYGGWLSEVALSVWLTFWAVDRFGVAPIPVFIVEGICLFHTLAVVYVFDAQLFSSMSGVWSIACEERV